MTTMTTTTEAERDYIAKYLTPEAVLRDWLAFTVDGECFYSSETHANWRDANAILKQFKLPRARYTGLNKADRCIAYLDDCKVSRWVSDDGVHKMVFDDEGNPVSEWVRLVLLSEVLPRILYDATRSLYEEQMNSPATIQALADAVRELDRRLHDGSEFFGAIAAFAAGLDQDKM